LLPQNHRHMNANRRHRTNKIESGEGTRWTAKEESTR
jgi:hypothetical protein